MTLTAVPRYAAVPLINYLLRCRNRVAGSQ